MKKSIKIAFKILGGLLLIAMVSIGVLYMVYNEPLPKGKTGSEADILAQKMLKAIDYEAYENTRFLEWSFASGAHHYKWDKRMGHVNVRWDGYSVDLNLNNLAKSTVLQNGSEFTKKEASEIYQTAWDYFNNDSFWLVAPFKVFDTGTKRSIVKLDDESNGLLVTYDNGGSTPGDSYLWRLNADAFPESYRMWVQIIPIGGLEATWGDWQNMQSGASLPVSHQIGPITLTMGKVKAYN